MRKASWLLLTVLPAFVHAQSFEFSVPKIPIRQIEIVAKSTEPLGAQVTVRALSNGTTLVNDFGRYRVVLFDRDLARFRSVIDSASGGSDIIYSAQLIRYAADSTLYVDRATQSLLVISPQGKIARVMALPKPRDARFVASVNFGDPQIDRTGGLVYRVQYPLQQKGPVANSNVVMSFPPQPDSAPILRADFDTRQVDTITTIKVPQPESMTQTRDGAGNQTMMITINPMGTGDEWAMLSDGTIAIVRVHDYHIDWIDIDRSRRSTPKMPFDWRPITQEKKQFRLDSLRPIMQKQIDQMPARFVETAEGRRMLRTQFEFVPLKELPEFEPPIGPGSVKADLSNHLWILPHTSASAVGGLLYDVITKQGEITYRVQFPRGYALAGFGPGDDIFVLRIEGKTGFLERAKIH